MAALLLLAAGLWMPGLPAHAATPRVEKFDHNTWAEMSAALPRPAMVIFSATWCANCPAIISDLSVTARSLAPQSPLVIVVVDGARHPALLNAAHYRNAKRLMVFDGDEAALRYTVSPRWRGLTPYVALLAKRGGPAVLVSGRPQPEQLAAWAAD